MISLFTLVLVIIIADTVAFSLHTLEAQNMTIKMGNATGGSNNTGNVTITGNEVSSGVVANLAKPGYGYKYDLLVNGKSVPVNYNILQCSLVGILADPTRHSLNVAVNPGPQGGALEIELPRHTIDSKDSAGNDMPYIVKIDGQRISGEPTGVCVGDCHNIFNSFKETQNTNTDRVLTIV
jgi:hypothetical protein